MLLSHSGDDELGSKGETVTKMAVKEFAKLAAVVLLSKEAEDEERTWFCWKF